MIDMVPEENSNVVHIPVIEHLYKQDYEEFVPRIFELVKKHGKVRILFDLARFHGWNEGARWFGIHHLPEVERVAFIGEKQWENGIDTFCTAFKKAQIRYFDSGVKDQALAWVKEDGQPPDGACRQVGFSGEMAFAHEMEDTRK